MALEETDGSCPTHEDQEQSLYRNLVEIAWSDEPIARKCCKLCARIDLFSLILNNETNVCGVPP